MGTKRLGMSQLAKDAGFSTRIWSEPGYWGGRLYHLIIAGGTSIILLSSSLHHVSLPILTGWLVSYGLYLLIRYKFIKKHETTFYRPLPQFVRAQISIALLTAIIAWLGEPGLHAYLWVLYTLPLITIGRHLGLSWLLISIFEVWALLTALRLWLVPESSPMLFVQANSDLIAQGIWLVLINSIIYYLLRNIDARDETIAFMSQVNALADRHQTGLELETRWEAVLGVYLRHVGGQGASVWLCNQRTGEIRPLSNLSYRLGKSRLIINRPDSQEPIGADSDHPVAQVAHTGQPIYCRAQSTLGDYLARTPDQVQVCTLPAEVYARILVPITEQGRDNGRVLGVLSIDFERSRPPREHLLPHYFEFLSDMAQRVVPILKFIWHMEEQQMLRHIGVQVSSSLRLRNVLSDTLDALTGPLGFQLATLSLVDEEAQLIRCVDGRNVPPEWIAQACHHLDSTDIQADIVRRGKSEVIKGWDERFDRRMYKRFHHEQLIRAFVPICRQREDDSPASKVQGVVEVGYNLRTQDQIAPDQLALLTTFVDQVAVAIEKARLFEDTLRHRKLLTQLHQVSHDIACARHIDEVLATVGEALRHVLQADIVMIYHFDRKTHTIDPPQVFGELWGRRPIREAPVDRGIIAKILHEGHSFYVPDAATNPLLREPYPPLANGEKAGCRRTFTVRQNIKSFAGVPMLVEGEAVGVLCVNYRRRHAFGENERCVLELAAQLVAIALRNTEFSALSAELAVEEERSRLVGQMHDSVSQFVSAIQLMADTASHQLSSRPDRTAHWLARIQHAARQTMTEVRVNLFEMGVTTTRSRNLRQALLESVELAREYFKLEVDISTETVPEKLRIPIEAELLLVCREAITNAARHSGARRVTLQLSEVNRGVFLQVQDDGCGFDLSALSTQGMRGLKLMRQRVERMGGCFSIDSQPGRGTILEAIVPT